MSAYELQKLIYHVNPDPDLRGGYQADAAKFAGGYEVSAYEPGVPWATGCGLAQFRNSDE